MCIGLCFLYPMKLWRRGFFPSTEWEKIHDDRVARRVHDCRLYLRHVLAIVTAIPRAIYQIFANVFCLCVIPLLLVVIVAALLFFASVFCGTVWDTFNLFFTTGDSENMRASQSFSASSRYGTTDSQGNLYASFGSTSSSPEEDDHSALDNQQPRRVSSVPEATLTSLARIGMRLGFEVHRVLFDELSTQELNAALNRLERDAPTWHLFLAELVREYGSDSPHALNPALESLLRSVYAKLTQYERETQGYSSAPSFEKRKVNDVPSHFIPHYQDVQEPSFGSKLTREAKRRLEVVEHVNKRHREVRERQESSQQSSSSGPSISGDVKREVHADSSRIYVSKRDGSTQEVDISVTSTPSQSDIVRLNWTISTQNSIIGAIDVGLCFVANVPDFPANVGCLLKYIFPIPYTVPSFFGPFLAFDCDCDDVGKASCFSGLGIFSNTLEVIQAGVSYLSSIKAGGISDFFKSHRDDIPDWVEAAFFLEPPGDRPVINVFICYVLHSLCAFIFGFLIFLIVMSLGVCTKAYFRMTLHWQRIRLLREHRKMWRATIEPGEDTIALDSLARSVFDRLGSHTKTKRLSMTEYYRKRAKYDAQHVERFAAIIHPEPLDEEQERKVIELVRREVGSYARSNPPAQRVILTGDTKEQSVAPSIETLPLHHALEWDRNPTNAALGLFDK